MRSTERGERTSSTGLRELKLIELINYRIGCVLSLAVQELAVRSLGDSGKVRVHTLAQTVPRPISGSCSRLITYR